MNRSDYKSIVPLILLILCLLCMMSMSGCSNEQDKDTVSTVVNTDTQGQAETVEDGIYIMLYMLNDDSWETEINEETEDADAELTTTVVAEISEKDLNAETIITKYDEIVVQSLYGELFIVNKVTETGNKVIVDFDGESIVAIGITEGEEGQLFYNLARSIDENLGDISDIYFTMDGGKDFRLGHLWFTADQPFYSGRELAE